MCTCVSVCTCTPHSPHHGYWYWNYNQDNFKSILKIKCQLTKNSLMIYCLCDPSWIFNPCFPLFFWTDTVTSLLFTCLSHFFYMHSAGPPYLWVQDPLSSEDPWANSGKLGWKVWGMFMYKRMCEEVRIGVSLLLARGTFLHPLALHSLQFLFLYLIRG